MVSNSTQILVKDFQNYFLTAVVSIVCRNVAENVVMRQTLRFIQFDLSVPALFLCRVEFLHRHVVSFPFPFEHCPVATITNPSVCTE